MSNQGRKSRSIGIDYGRARIGMAMSDERKIIASPLTTIKAEKKIEDSVAKVATEIARLEESGKGIDEVVVGLPLKMNGSMSSMTDEAVQFSDLLREAITCPLVTWDERLTSMQADRSMRDAKLSRKKRAKAIDSIAAVLILQSYLDGKSNTLMPEMPNFPDNF
ncbi:MAG: putative Holliday junction resolvase [Halioglobus sp.]|jgi:putative Holliday junction resolvase